MPWCSTNSAASGAARDYRTRAQPARRRGAAPGSRVGAAFCRAESLARRSHRPPRVARPALRTRPRAKRPVDAAYRRGRHVTLAAHRTVGEEVGVEVAEVERVEVGVLHASDARPHVPLHRARGNSSPSTASTTAARRSTTARDTRRVSTHQPSPPRRHRSRPARDQGPAQRHAESRTRPSSVADDGQSPVAANVDDIRPRAASPSDASSHRDLRVRKAHRGT